MSIIRNVSTMGGATLASRALALVRDIGVAAVLGAGALADAYFVALLIPNLFRRLLAEGAVNGAFVPIWLRLRGENSGDAANRFGESVLGTLLIALGGFVLVCMALAPLVIYLTAPGFGGERFDAAVEFLRLSVVYVVIAGVVAIACAILIAEGQVAAAAASIVVFNVVLVLAVLIVATLGSGETGRSGAILAVSIAIAGVAQLALVGIALTRRRPRRISWKPSDEARLFYARALPALIAAGIPQLALIAGTIIASSSVAAVSWLYYAYRLYELPLGIISVALAGVLGPRIAANVQARLPAATRLAQSQALELALGLALPAAAGLATLSLPIASLLFERGSFDADDTLAVAAALTILVIGLPGHALEKVFAATSFAHEDTRLPMHAALGGLAAAIVVALLLMRPFGHVGIAFGIAVAGWASSAWLFHALRLRGQVGIDAEARTRLGRIGLATVIMAATLIVLLVLMVLIVGRPVSTIGQLVTLVILIGAGLAAYAGSLQRFGVISLRELTALARLRA